MSLWFLLLVAVAFSVLQASHGSIRTDSKRHSMKTAAEANSWSAEALISQPRLQCGNEQTPCYPDLLDFNGKEMEGSFGAKSSEEAALSDYLCSTECLSCDPDKCQLPNCKCSNLTIPGKVPRYDAPIIVIVTVQGAVHKDTYEAFLELFDGLRNPNDCPATGTYFVSHLKTDYFLVQSLRSKGHEIGDYTVNGTSNTRDYWRNADCTEWLNQFKDELTILMNLANVTDVRGFRSPYLQLGGDSQMIALEELQQRNHLQQQQQQNHLQQEEDGEMGRQSFVYDASRVSRVVSNSSELLWPYTYDYNSTQDCATPPCPKYCHKGIWEIPLLAFRDGSKKPCSALYDCNVQTYNDVFRLLYDRLSGRFDSNRAPLVLTMDSEWITNPMKRKGTRLFLQHALSYKAVYVVSAGQALDWIRSPVPLSNITQFEPWSCSQPGPTVCAEPTTKTCAYNSKRRKPRKKAKGVAYQFRTCAATCPKCYPWMGDPQGKRC